MTIDFCVIGAQKCATSWMYYCLNEHPNIRMPLKKNDNIFYSPELDLNEYIRNNYNTNFTNKSIVINGDISVDYSENLESLLELKNINNRLKCIYMVRNSYERTVSALLWYIRRGKTTNLNIVYECEQFAKDLISNDLYTDVYNRSLYTDKIKVLLKHNIEVLVIPYEKVNKSPAETITTVYDFLEVKNDFIPNNLLIKPKKNNNIKVLNYLERIIPLRGVNKIIDVINRTINKELDYSELILKLKPIYNEENHKFKELIQNNDMIFKNDIIYEIDKYDN